MDNNIYDDLKKIAGENNVLTDEPMKKHVTFRTGGNADYFVTVRSAEELSGIIRYLRKEKVPYYIIGNGSNLLFEDQGYRGVIVKMGRFADDIKVSGNSVQAGAGVLLSQAANAAYEHSLTGMEFAAGIPGTVGGAVVMNAGAYGGEIKDIIVCAKAVNEKGEMITLTREELELGYRHSIVADSENKLIITEAEFQLSAGDKTAIRAQMDELAQRRREKQPLEYPSAGSTFKRPEGYFAGKLIQDAGLKGFSVGGAQVSEKHSGFVINRGNATTKDILTLIKAVQDMVYDKFGVKLEMEVKVVK